MRGEDNDPFRSFLRSLPDEIARAGARGQPIVFACEAEPAEHVRALMATLGVPIVSTDPRPERARTMGNFTPTYELDDGPGGNGHREPDWIDYRASVARAARRLDAGVTVTRCASCGTELDVDEVVHSPKCRGGDPVTAKATVAAELEPSTNGNGATAPARQTRHRWSVDEIVAAVQRWADEHDGKPPSQTQWIRRGEWWPAFSTALRPFGSWGALLQAAGFTETRTNPAGRPIRLDQTTRQEPPVVWQVKVPGTGLRYRTVDEAYVAADEIEYDGEKVAGTARFAGDEGKADRAIDAARALAEKVRDAARAADGTPELEPLPTSSLLEALPRVAAGEQLDGWRQRFLAEADRLERHAAGYRLLEQGLALLSDHAEASA